MRIQDGGAATGVPLGRYRLIALLGQGGMADVYLACTQGAGGFQKLLVVKLARLTGEPTFATMFLAEARIAAQLSHPNIIQTFEIGEEVTRHYIVMEYLDGGNLGRLRQRLAKRGGMPLRISLHILLQVLEGLEYAHEAIAIDGRPLRVVHRDLSPSNIMCTTQGAVKILDFGIAKAAGTAGLTLTGKLSGKLQYMPPEQLRGESVDARADLFAIGIMIAEAVLGHRLWGNLTDPAIVVELGMGRIPSLDRGIPIAPELRRICDKALAPDREARYATAHALKEDLAAFAATLGPPVSSRELAELVRAVTEPDRAKLQALIDGQLQRGAQPTRAVDGTPIELPRMDQTPVSQPRFPRPGTELDDNGALGRAMTTPGAGPLQTPAPPPAFPGLDPGLAHAAGPATGSAAGQTGPSALGFAAPPRVRPARWVAIAGPVIVAIVAGGIWLARSGPRERVAAATPGPDHPAPSTVRFEVVVQPADATVTLDGKALGANPFVGQLARDAGSHQLEASAPGYQPLIQLVALERDASFHLSLARLTPAPEAAAPPPAPPMSARPAPAAPAERPRRPPLSPVVSARPAPPRAVAPEPPPQPQPQLTAPPNAPPSEAKPRAVPDGKRALDPSALEVPASGKRALDSDVLESGSNKPKPKLDRENPWEN